MQLKFKVDTARLTFGDLLDMEGGKLTSMFGVMSRCLVNESDEYLPEKEAVKQLRAIPLNDLKEAAEAFGKAMEAFKDSATPTNGGNK